MSVDSWLDTSSLNWLVDEGRLKSDESPVGLMPGEAASILLLEPLERQTTAFKTLSIISNPVVKFSSVGDFKSEPNHGRVLSSCIKETLKNKEQNFDGYIYHDTNGEHWKSYEYGSAKVMLVKELEQAKAEVYSADSIGDTGAVTPSISLLQATHLFSRINLPNQQALILSQSMNGSTGTFLVSKGN